MTNMESGVVVPLLKTDALGRVRTPASRREHLLDEFERSGMSGLPFAEFVGIKYQTFATWVQLRRRRRKSAANPKPPGKADATKQVRWMEAVVEPAHAPGTGDQTRSALVVQLPCGVRVEIADAKQVALAVVLVRALGQPALSC